MKLRVENKGFKKSTTLYRGSNNSLPYAKKASYIQNTFHHRLATLLQLLCERAEVGRRHFHADVFSGRRIKHALLDDIRLERAPRGTQRVATEVTR